MKKILPWPLVAAALALVLAGCSSPVTSNTASVSLSTVSRSAWGLSGSTITHDPTIINDGSMWWEFNTGTGLPVKYSSDGKTWYDGTQIFSSALSWWTTYAPDMSTNDVWAPDIHYYNGKYWLYYAVSVYGEKTSAIGLTSCSSILSGGWTDDGMVISSGSSTAYNAIDPDLTFDASGNPWLVFGSWFGGIYIVPLSSSTMKPDGTPVKIAARPSDSNALEGASLVYRNGYYYLFMSWDICCDGVNSTYKIAYGRSTSINSGYVDKSGTSLTSGGGTILVNSQTDPRWVASGGEFVYDYDGTWLMAYHSYDAFDSGAATLRINNLYFSSNWPTLEETYSGYYRLENRTTGKYLDSLGTTTDGAQVGQWSSSSSYNQQWWLVDVGGGYYNLVCRTGTMALDSVDVTATGGAVGLWTGTISYNQQWEVESLSNGYYKIINRSNGLCLDTGGNTSNGSGMEFWPSSQSYNQQWAISTAP